MIRAMSSLRGSPRPRISPFSNLASKYRPRPRLISAVESLHLPPALRHSQCPSPSPTATSCPDRAIKRQQQQPPSNLLQAVFPSLLVSIVQTPSRAAKTVRKTQQRRSSPFKQTQYSDCAPLNRKVTLPPSSLHPPRICIPDRA
jgi:hypothetical protein